MCLEFQIASTGCSGCQMQRHWCKETSSYLNAMNTNTTTWTKLNILMNIVSSQWTSASTCTTLPGLARLRLGVGCCRCCSSLLSLLTRRFEPSPSHTCLGFAAMPIPTSVTQSSIRLHHSAGYQPDPLQHNTKIPLSIKTNAKNYNKLQFHVLPSNIGPNSSIPTHKPNRYQHKGPIHQTDTSTKLSKRLLYQKCLALSIGPPDCNQLAQILMYDPKPSPESWSKKKTQTTSMMNGNSNVGRHLLAF
jgi:hypothetical protein